MRIHPRARSLFVPAALALLAAAAHPALASYGSKPEAPPPTPSSDSQREPGAPPTVREQAQPYFGDAWKDVEKGSAELAAGKSESAQKRFRRALERSRRAVEIDSTFYQAWNLVGYTSRRLGDYPAAFKAYQVAIYLKPDFAQAREYYGEGLVETGDLPGAKQQLAALQKIGDAKLAAELQASIAKYEAAHPPTTSSQ
jgi:tetratricopeptide (TPR) repeat protein